MGKSHDQRLPVLPVQAPRRFRCRRVSIVAQKLCSLKCAVVLVLSVAAFISVLFSVLPSRRAQAGFDAKDSIKLSATVQANFRLQKPISDLIPYISRLEYDINGEIGVPSSKVAVLSMHQADISNYTNVVFGFLPDPINSTIYPVSLSVLKSSLIDLFFQQYNLTLTSSIFGEVSSFEILKFPGGITVIPERAAIILQVPQSLFNFTLNSSVYEIKENVQELKEQLKSGLHLMNDEVLYIQVTNQHGSTVDPPITVEASILSNLGTLQPERLRQLAQIITWSPSTQNLGLDHSVFGKVKEISLSSFLNHSIHAPTPSPTPTPTPTPSPSPSPTPSQSPDSHQPIAPSPVSLPRHSLSPAPTVAHPSPTPHWDKMSPKISPNLSPSASPPYGSRGEERQKILASPPQVSSSFSSSAVGTLRIWLFFYFIGLATFLLLFWTS